MHTFSKIDDHHFVFIHLWGNEANPIFVLILLPNRLIFHLKYIYIIKNVNITKYLVYLKKGDGVLRFLAFGE